MNRNRTKTVLTLAVVTLAVFAGPAQAGPVEGELGILTPDTLAGNNPATGAPWAAGDNYRFAFIASAKRTAESSDIEDYNAWVQNLANATTVYDIGVDEGVTWKVIGSTTDVDARDNTSTNPTVESGHAIFLLDGSTVVANDYADLWDHEIQNIINLNEKGEDPFGLGDPFLVWPWTGTFWDGTSRTGGPRADPLGGPGEVGQGDASSTTDWIYRVWTMDPMTNSITMYALSDPLVIVSTTLAWQGGTGDWADSNWTTTPGTTENSPPLASTAMVINAAAGESVVTVASDFTTALGGGPAASVTVGETYLATLNVNSEVMLEVTGQVLAGENGTLNVDGNLSAAEVICEGTLSGTGTVEADFIEIVGVVSPGVVSLGGSVGTLTVDGEMELIEGKYLCEIDATGADRLHNANEDEAIILSYEGGGGTLELLVLEALGVPGCYTDTILSTSGAGVIDGEFPDGQKPAEGYLDYGVFLDGYETVNTGTGFNYNLNLFQAGQGDTDGDGDVDLDDLSALDDGWDPTAEDKIWTDGDVDGDGDVDLDDLSLLDDAWAPAGYPVVNCPFGGGDGLGATAVPEPGTLALLAIGLLGLALWRGDRHWATCLRSAGKRRTSASSRGSRPRSPDA